MKRLIGLSIVAAALGTVSAHAADLAARPYTKAPAYVAPAYYNWTGFYVGGHIGGGWGSTDNHSGAPGTGAFPTGTPYNSGSSSGFLGGLQGGFNWQVAPNFVLGIEGEYSWTDVKSDPTSTHGLFSVTTTNSTKTDDIAMVTGRIGYAANEWLLYAKGGWAWVDGGSSGVVTRPGFANDYTSTSVSRDGWVAGVGVEWGFAPNWSAKLEYNHIDFGSTLVTVDHSNGTTSFTDSASKMDIVKAGLNYRFNFGGPVVAKY